MSHLSLLVRSEIKSILLTEAHCWTGITLKMQFKETFSIFSLLYQSYSLSLWVPCTTTSNVFVRIGLCLTPILPPLRVCASLYYFERFCGVLYGRPLVLLTAQGVVNKGLHKKVRVWSYADTCRPCRRSQASTFLYYSSIYCRCSLYAARP